MEHTVVKQQKFIKSKLTEYMESIKWSWRKVREGNLVHHYGRLVGTIQEIHYSTDESGVVSDAGNGDKYYIYYSDGRKEDRYFENLGDAESEILQMQLDKIRKTAHTQFLATLDKYIYCSVCGEKKHTKYIGVVYNSHTCTECADNMGEKCQQVGFQHL